MIIKSSATVHRKSSGFTIVELLIVIVVIAILASITVVAFTGVQQRARQVSLQTDLRNANQLLAIDQTRAAGVWAPTGLASETKVSGGNVLQLTSYNGESGEYCVEGGRTDNQVPLMSWRSDSGYKETSCPGTPIGAAVGGTMPIAPRNINLAPPLADWTSSGSGAVYDSASGELKLTKNTYHSFLSPKIRVDSARIVTLKLKSFSTTASSYFGTESGVYTGSVYWGVGGTSQVMNTANYPANGNAQAAPLGVWDDYTTQYELGPNVKYLQININSGVYTSDNRIKDVEITIAD